MIGDLRSVVQLAKTGFWFLLDFIVLSRIPYNINI